MRQIVHAVTPDCLFRLGPRARFLLYLGIGWILIGVDVWFREVPTERQFMYHLHLPIWLRSAVWVVTGVIAVVFAFRRNSTPGFAALYLMPAIRSSSFFLAWAASDPMPGPNAWWMIVLGLVGMAGLWLGTYRRLSNGRVAVLALLSMALALLLMVVLSYSSDPTVGNPQGWYGCVLWLLYILVILNASAWPEKIPRSELRLPERRSH